MKTPCALRTDWAVLSWLLTDTLVWYTKTCSLKHRGQIHIHLSFFILWFNYLKCQGLNELLKMRYNSSWNTVTILKVDGLHVLSFWHLGFIPYIAKETCFEWKFPILRSFTWPFWFCILIFDNMNRKVLNTALLQGEWTHRENKLFLLIREMYLYSFYEFFHQKDLKLEKLHIFIECSCEWGSWCR